jgi:CheY-like chemotaxis protein
VYGIVKQSGAAIEVASELGLGTTFRIYFPRVDAPIPDPLPPAPPESGGPRSETVLLVEDEPEVRHLVAEILRSYGYAVLEPTDAAEAVRLAREHPGRIDLLLTDIVMPLMSGPEVARAVLEARPESRVLFMSGYPGSAIGERGRLTGDAALIAKPFTASALAAKLRDVLGPSQSAPA